MRWPSQCTLNSAGCNNTALAMSKNQNSDFERKLQGRTLNVYLYLQRKREPSGIREVQRDLGLSSPSVADYQVEKLVEMGLAARDTHGRVYITKHVRVKALQSYVSLGNHTVPRLAFYATIFTAIAALVFFSFESISIYGVAVPAAAAAIFWYEAAKMWRISLLQRVHAAKQYDNSDFWVSLVPGIAALAAFIAAAFFLFYYVEPNDLAPSAPPLTDPSRQIPDSSSQPMTANDLLRLSPQNAGAGSHGELVSNFPPSLITGFLFTGALVAGFLVYLLVRLRSNGDVLQVEQC